MKPHSNNPSQNPGIIFRVAVLATAIALLGGCASHEAIGPASDSRAAGLLARSRSLANTFNARMGFAVAAADLTAKDIARGGGDGDRGIYNAACTEAAVLSRNVSLPATLQTPAGTYRVELDSGRAAGCWNPAFFSKLIPTTDIKNKSLVSRKPPAGYGGVLVGVHRPSNPRALYMPKAGISAPVTAVLNTLPPAQAGGPARATLTLFDSSKRDTASIAGANRPLAADLSAPFGYYPIPPKMGVLGMLRPEQFFKMEGIFLAQPYDAKKIPLVFIHGLMSDPSMWLPVMANIESDPILRGKYQFSVFAYPTGDPIEKLALRTAQRSFAEEALRFDRHSWAVGRVTSRAISA